VSRTGQAVREECVNFNGRRWLREISKGLQRGVNWRKMSVFQAKQRDISDAVPS
jgi:hypothetical protein